MFLFKKLVSPFLFPEPVLFLLMLAGVVCIWRKRRGLQSTGRWLLTISFLLFALVSLRPAPRLALSSIEGRYAPMYSQSHIDQAKWIAVLSGGVSDDPALIASHQLSVTTLARLAEGIRLARLNPGAKMIVSGGGPFAATTGAVAMAETARMLGFDENRIVLESASLDTEQQAERIAELTGEDPVLLVTSASHMPRSVSLFRRQGVQVIPAPTDFWVKRPQRFHPQSVFPAARNIWAARTAIREGLGMLWSKMRGRA